MPFRITDDCVACSGCLVVCPQNAIEDGYLTSASGGATVGGAGPQWTSFYRIMDNCDECGRCLDVCPTAAIVS